MPVIVSRLSRVALFVLETIFWVFIVKAFEVGFKQLKSWRSKPDAIEA